MEHNIGAKVIHKALDILLLFKEKKEPLGVTEISKQLGLPKPTVSRILNTLFQRGFLVRDRENQKYFLSPIFYSFASVVSERNELISVAKEEMEAISRTFRETVHLNVLDNGERLCVLVFDSPQTLKAVMPVGQRSPLYCGGSSKAIFAFLEDEEIEEIISRGLSPVTENTITDPERLREEVARIRKRGYAVSHGERVRGVTSISAPIFSKSGVVIGSLTVSVPTVRHTLELEERIAARLKEASAKITRYYGKL